MARLDRVIESQTNHLKMVCIPREEYDTLLAAEDHLALLHELGVDNWSGYRTKREIYKEED